MCFTLVAWFCSCDALHLVCVSLCRLRNLSSCFHPLTRLDRCVSSDTQTTFLFLSFLISCYNHCWAGKLRPQQSAFSSFSQQQQQTPLCFGLCWNKDALIGCWQYQRISALSFALSFNLWSSAGGAVLQTHISLTVSSSCDWSSFVRTSC